MQKIDDKRITKYGSNFYTLPLPKIFIKDNGLKTGDTLDIYRTETNGKDSLVIMVNPKSKETENKEQIN